MATLKSDGSNKSQFEQRELVDALVALLVVADEASSKRTAAEIRAIVGDETTGLWRAILDYTSAADMWLTEAQA
jgi:hypothetical protein